MNQTTGISEEAVENYEECEELIRSLTCCICLEIAKNPYECENCESLYCFECWDLMKISGKNCVYNCKTPIIKAKKFIFDMLSKIRFLCDICHKHNIPYKTYLRHMQICKLNTKLENIEESENLLKEKKGRIDEIEKEVEKEKVQPLHQEESTYNLLKDKEKLRKKYIVNFLSSSQKKELYNSVCEGNLEKFSNLIMGKKYNILEEISASGYFWTSFHYAMHYGKLNLIFFILEFFYKNGGNELNEVMRLESNDGRCPLMCLMKSNSLNSDTKKEYLETIFQKFKFYVSNELIRELKNRDFNYMIEKFKLKVIN